ncbi:MAG TPA: PIG-L family deacetylase [Vicinamibacterales bacterium]
MSADERFDVLAFAAHPDDLEVAMGGTTAKLSDQGLTTLFVDLSDGEPTRHAARGARRVEAADAARILGVSRVTLDMQDRWITDTLETRLAVARLIRIHRPRYVFTTKGSGVHPDHRAATDIVTGGVFYARLPKWDEVGAAGHVLDGTGPHKIDRLFYARCRMEPAWPSFDFAVDVSAWYERKRAAIAAYRSVFAGTQAGLVERYAAEDQYYGSLLGVRQAEPFQALSPLLVSDPTVIARAPFG